MTRLAEYYLPDGTLVYAEVDDSEWEDIPDEWLIPATSADDLVQKVGASIEDVFVSVRGIAKCAVEQLKSLEVTPDEVTLELGIKLSGSTRVIIASADAEASMVLTLKWVNNR